MLYLNGSLQGTITLFLFLTAGLNEIPIGIGAHMNINSSLHILHHSPFPHRGCIQCCCRSCGTIYCCSCYLLEKTYPWTIPVAEAPQVSSDDQSAISGNPVETTS